MEFCATANPLHLTELTLKTSLEGKTYKEISEDPSLVGNIREFENSPIRTIIIRNWPSEKFLYVIFFRLNSGSLPLSPQELRKALHPGELLDYIEAYLEKGKGIARVMALSTPDRRMRDSELVLRYIAFEFFYPSKYKSSFKTFLDDTVKFFNENWQREKSNLDSVLTSLDRAIDVSIKIFGQRDVFRKWNGSNYEKRINRAVFDVITRYFSTDAVINAAINDAQNVKETFCKMCVNDLEFKRSIEQTTKSPLATKTKLNSWGKELSSILHLSFNQETLRIG